MRVQSTVCACMACIYRIQSTPVSTRKGWHDGIRQTVLAASDASHEVLELLLSKGAEGVEGCVHNPVMVLVKRTAPHYCCEPTCLPTWTGAKHSCIQRIMGCGRTWLLSRSARWWWRSAGRRGTCVYQPPPTAALSAGTHWLSFRIISTKPTAWPAKYATVCWCHWQLCEHMKQERVWCDCATTNPASARA